MIHFWETLDQIEVQLSLELNVIETNQYFSTDRGVNQMVMMHKLDTQLKRKSKKRGSSSRNFPTMPKYGSSTPLPPPQGILQVALESAYLVQKCQCGLFVYA